MPPPPAPPQGMAMDMGSPINSGKNMDDDLDFEKEILDAANQSQYPAGGDG